MRSTDKLHANFLKDFANSIHFKYNKDAHTKGIFIELGQYNRNIDDYPLNGYWTNQKIKLLVFGNEKIKFIFKKDTLLDYINDNANMIGIYLNGKVQGMPITITQTLKIADIIV